MAVNYTQLENRNGTIFNTATGKAYATPTQLAADLGILPHQINWTNIKAAPTAQPVAQQAVTPENSLGEYQELYNELEKYVSELEKRGQAINPNIQITPEKMAEFLGQAEREITPFYQTQAKLARESLQRQLGYSQKNIEDFETDLERKYGRSLRTLGEESAEQGFAQSGLRQRDERELALETNRQLERNRSAVDFASGTAARQFAQQYGVSDIPHGTRQGLPSAVSGEFKFNRPGTSSSFYELSPSVYEGLVGQQEFQRRGAVSQRASELEEAFRTQEANAKLRQLTF